MTLRSASIAFALLIMACSSSPVGPDANFKTGQIIFSPFGINYSWLYSFESTVTPGINTADRNKTCTYSQKRVQISNVLSANDSAIIELIILDSGIITHGEDTTEIFDTTNIVVVEKNGKFFSTDGNPHAFFLYRNDIDNSKSLQFRASAFSIDDSSYYIDSVSMENDTKSILVSQRPTDWSTYIYKEAIGLVEFNYSQQMGRAGSITTRMTCKWASTTRIIDSSGIW